MEDRQAMNAYTWGEKKAEEDWWVLKTYMREQKREWRVTWLRLQINGLKLGGRMSALRNTHRRKRLLKKYGGG